MPIKRSLIIITLAGLLCTGVQAQTRVYETTDADGNPVFSDSPSEDAQTVEIPATNAANSTSPMPAAPTATAGARSVEPGGTPEQGPNIIVINDEHRRRAAQGDGFITKETPDGPIIVNEREQLRALKEHEEYFVDHQGVQRIRVRKGGHRGR